MNNPLMNYHFLNCTKEVIYCLEEAKRIAILQSSKRVVRPIHLCITLLFYSKLVQKALKINLSRWDINSVLNIIFNSNLSFKKEINLQETDLQVSIDKDILILLNILNTWKYPFNTLLLFSYLWRTNPNVYSFLFALLNIENSNYKFNILECYTKNFLPTINIPSILRDLLSRIKVKNNIIGRKKEIEEITAILERKLNRNVILLGEAGVGKTAIVHKIISLMPKKIFLELNISNLLAQYNNNTCLETFLGFLEQQRNIILYCKDFHLLFVNSVSDVTFLKNKIYKMLQLNNIQIIGTSTTTLYEKLLQTEEQLKFSFSKVFITEPEKYSLLLILKQYLSDNNIYWVKDHHLETIIGLGEKFLNNYVFPKKGLLILDSLITVKKNSLIGDVLTQKEILAAISQYSNLSGTLILKESTTSDNISNINLDLKKYVFGQDIAVTKIATSLKRAYTGLKDKNKPIGSWLLCGPSGTGKTELVKSLALLLFGSEKELIRFDMSEFMEKHSVSKLIGPPPGYVGCEEGGLLTEAVKKKPYSVILFDEIEKAHKDVNNIMLQLLDEGTLTDSKGKHVDFTNTLIIYTSNLGCPTSPVQFKSFQNGQELSEEEYNLLSKNVDIAVKKFFRPEFLNRLDSVVVFKPLSMLCLTNIVNKFIANLLQKLKENNIPIQIEVEQDIKMLFAKLAYHPLYGARPLLRIIQQFIEKPLSELIINFKFKTPHLFSIYKDKDKETINYLIQKIKN